MAAGTLTDISREPRCLLVLEACIVERSSQTTTKEDNLKCTTLYKHYREEQFGGCYTFHYVILNARIVIGMCGWLAPIFKSELFFFERYSTPHY